MLPPAKRITSVADGLLDDDLDQKEDLIKVEMLESPAKVKKSAIQFKSSGMIGML